MPIVQQPPTDSRRPQPGFAGSPAPESAELGLDRDQPHDLLSALLRSVRLRGERIVAYAPPPGFSVGFTDVGALHIIDEGALALQVDGDPHVRRVGPGDAMLLARGDSHHIRDASKRAPGQPVPARWLCGTFTIGDPQASHLLASLPAVIILRGAGGPALEGLEVARRMLLIEMHSPSQGSAVMIARILDLLLIQILRASAAGADAESNWLTGVLDPQIGLALGAIHRDPRRDWTVEEMARSCSLSRSAFAARFVDRVGKPPATYLAHVRLDAATNLLRETSLTVARVAESVGYTSEAAFSRAFKNRYNTPPARWRREATADRPTT